MDTNHLREVLPPLAAKLMLHLLDSLQAREMEETETINVSCSALSTEIVEENVETVETEKPKKKKRKMSLLKKSLVYFSIFCGSLVVIGVLIGMSLSSKSKAIVVCNNGHRVEITRGMEAVCGTDSLKVKGL